MSSPFPNTPLVCVTLSIHLGISCVPPLSPQTLRLSSAPSFPGFIPWTLLCHCPLTPPACWSSMPGPSCAFPAELLCVCVCVSENVCVLVLLWLLPIGLRECCVHHHHGSQQTKVPPPVISSMLFHCASSWPLLNHITSIKNNFQGLIGHCANPGQLKYVP